MDRLRFFAMNPKLNSKIEELEAPPVKTTVSRQFAWNEYTHSGAHYTCECDGYASYYIAKGAPARFIQIYDSKGNHVQNYNPISSNASVDQVSQPIFVPKGSQIAFSDSDHIYASYTSMFWQPLG